MRTFTGLAIAALVLITSIGLVASFIYTIGAYLWFLKSGDWVWLTALDIDFLQPYIVAAHTEALSQSWIGLADSIFWVGELPIIVSGPLVLWFVIVLTIPFILMALDFWDGLGEPFN